MDVKERLQNLIVNLRNRCLFKGVGGIKELSVAFRRMDSDYNRRICYQEWMEGLEICGLDVTEEETCMLFVAFDTDKNGEIDFLEFVAKLRPPMNSVRSAVVNEAFDMLDHDHNGVLEIDDLKSNGVTVDAFFCAYVFSLLRKHNYFLRYDCYLVRS